MAEVFISYSWDSDEHNNKVLAFTNHLREKGFEAQLDRMLAQEETAVNFIKMMHLAMQNHSKIIVVLSPGYKQKAETFTGGVGEEYQVLLNDIKNNPKKYILVAFAERSQDIIPLGLLGRDVVSLSKEGEEERLFRKLLDEQEFKFSKVAPEKPKIATKLIPPFSITQKLIQAPIEVTNLLIKQESASLSGGLYNHVDLSLSFEMKNISQTSIDNYAVELRLSKYFDSDYYIKQTDGEEIVYTHDVTDKLFPNQIKRSKNYLIRITNHVILKILDSTIQIKVFTDDGIIEKKYLASEVIKIRFQGNYNSEPVAIRQSLFAH